MRKIYFVSAAFALFAATTVSAQSLKSLRSDFSFGQSKMLVNKGQGHQSRLNAEGHKTLDGSKINKNKAHKAPSDSGIITEQPEGNLITTSVTADGYYSFWGYIFSNSASGNIGKVVEAADGSIYIYNPISTIQTNTWVKAEKTVGDTLVVSSKTPVYQEDYNGEIYNYYLSQLTYDEAEGWFVYNEGDDIKYTYKDGVLTYVGTDDYSTLVGLVDDTDEWVGYGDVTSVSAPVTDTPNAAPAGIEYSDYTLASDDYTGLVKVGFDGNQVYVKNLPGINEDFVLKGTISGDAVTFENNQYLGADEEVGLHVYLKNAKAIYEEDPETYEYTLTDVQSVDEALEFTYNEERKAFYNYDNAFVLNGGKDQIYYVGLYSAPAFNPWTEIADIPGEPYFTSFTPYDEDYGYGRFSFNIPYWGWESDYLNRDKLTYNIFFDVKNDDGSASTHEDVEPYVLDPADYTALTEELVDIPCEFTDGWDIYVEGKAHTIYYYVAEFDYVGVQTTYTGGGETHKSELVWYDVEAAGIKAATGIDEGKNVKSITYTDILGRRIAQPTNGLYIKTVTYTDGTKKTIKAIK